LAQKAEGEEMNTPTQFEFQASEDGKHVIFTATEKNQEPVSLSIPPDFIGQFVVGLLDSAIACAQLDKSTAQPFSGENEQQELTFVQANGVALQDVTDRPDVVAVTFLFGQTRVAIGLNRAALQPLGTALLAASADQARPQ
jgi:hypothetical protein